MRLTVIGCYGAYPPPGGATSGYLIEDAVTKVLLDCGSGVLTCLQQYVPLSELDAVVMTHYHPDHCADFGCLKYAAMIDRQLGRRHKSLAAWGPGNPEILSYGEYCEGRSYVGMTSFQIGSLTFEAIENIHEVPGFAIRVTSTDRSVLVYTGDTAYYEGLAQFARCAGCFLCEASFYAERPEHSAQHLSAIDAAALAEKARVKTLILTHLPHFGEPEHLVSLAETVYSGRVLLAKQWLQIAI